MNVLDMLKRLAAMGVRERPGHRHHPAIQWAHELCKLGEGMGDEIAWCSSVMNLAAMLVNAPRSSSASARSWIDPALGDLFTDRSQMRDLLSSGTLKPGYVILVFKRGDGAGQLGPEVKKAPGHVAAYEEYIRGEQDKVRVFGGNQANIMSSTTFLFEDVIAVLVLRRQT